MPATSEAFGRMQVTENNEVDFLWRARFKIRILHPETGDVGSFCYESEPHDFTPDLSNWGWSAFATRSSLVKQGLVAKDGSLTLKILLVTSD
ncbi:hypothetical protein KIPB_012077 [Kipferlia bialata]|uniref:MATH domain-containing protein n=1 Tax=Kipferlia bialata TaxID=797122 RepID=A0A9K3D8E2_9EUKA|nr:hypothetical protein KIPB_012077 [Kipferlia bialata]|eukprot:g12077.t1